VNLSHVLVSNLAAVFPFVSADRLGHELDLTP
jgi:hypothetical protein